MIELEDFIELEGVNKVFLTSFSYLSCYFLILGFSRSCYLLVCSRFSWLHRNQIFLSCFLKPWALQGSVWYMCPHVSDTDHAVSSEQDIHGTLVVDSVLGLFPNSALP
jgi:hypothetical protein